MSKKKTCVPPTPLFTRICQLFFQHGTLRKLYTYCLFCTSKLFNEQGTKHYFFFSISLPVVDHRLMLHLARIQSLSENRKQSCTKHCFPTLPMLLSHFFFLFPVYSFVFFLSSSPTPSSRVSLFLFGCLRFFFAVAR